MRRSSFSGRRSSAPLRHRIERAAGEMNPYLALVAIGLVLVNLIILAALSPHLRVSRRSEVPAATTEIGAIPAPAIGIATSAGSL